MSKARGVFGGLSSHLHTDAEAVRVIVSIAMVALGLAIWFASQDFFAPIQVDPLGPSFWPGFLGLAVAFFSAFDAVLGTLKLLRGKRAQASPIGEGDAPGDGSRLTVRLGAVLLLLALYIGLLQFVGYLLATPVFIGAVLATLGIRSWVGLIAPSVGLTLVWAALFEFGLGVPLPAGVSPY